MRIRVEGHHPLNGVYRPSGNANAAMALLAAALLTDQPVTLRNMPHTTSTRAMIHLAEKIGAQMTWHDQNTVEVRTEQITRRKLSPAETDSFAAVLLYLAPMLIRRQHVHLEVDFPLNRIRTHLDALRDLGVDVVMVNGAVECSVARWERKEILLAQSSVTATAMTLMLAACLGRETVIHNAACEPHAQELAHMLTAMGVGVDGIGSNVLRVYGRDVLKSCDVTIGPDHIEAGSVAAMAAMCGGRVEIAGVRQSDLRMVQKVYQRLGIQLDLDETSIFVPRHTALIISTREEDVDSSIESMPWPGFPSDLMSIATVAATQARGTSLIHEKLFSNRLLFVDKLKAMGAQIVLCDPHRAIVVGPTKLNNIYMDSPDVRAGLGLLGAALVAEGQSVIDNAQVIESVFSGVLDKLRGLGAKISVED